MRTHFLIVLAALLPSSVLAQELGVAVSDFDEGNRRYRTGDFHGAVDSYERALSRGYASEALFFNLGNAYFRLDDLGQAIRHYEKARRLAPESAQLKHNLSIARERTVDTFSRLPEPFWMPMWAAISRTPGPGGLFAIGVLFYLLAVGALALRIRAGQTSWRRRALAGGLVLAVCFVSLSFASSADQASTREAVVLADETTLRSTPAGEASEIRVHEGLVVRIVATSAEWREVRLPNGARGWVPSAHLGEI